MPIYEYKCNKCNTTQDKIVTYSDRKETSQCPLCFNGDLIYVDKIHNGSFYLKGTGWYQTDFRKK